MRRSISPSFAACVFCIAICMLDSFLYGLYPIASIVGGVLYCSFGMVNASFPLVRCMISLELKSLTLSVGVTRLAVAGEEQPDLSYCIPIVVGRAWCRLPMSVLVGEACMIPALNEAISQ